jgi:hypothetical protein
MYVDILTYTPSLNMSLRQEERKTMANVTTNTQTSVQSARPMLRQERARMQAWDDFDGCACCGSRFEVIRASRFGYVPFCQNCLDRTLHPGIWDEVGEAGD